MDYGKISLHVAGIVAAVIVGALLAGLEGAAIGLAYLFLLGLIGYNLSEIVDIVYFHVVGKALSDDETRLSDEGI
jgi:hypothetical protein